MSDIRNKPPRLSETLQSGLPAWTPRAGKAFILPDILSECDRFYYRTFGDCECPVTLYDADGQRLVDTLTEVGQSPFPDVVNTLVGRSMGPGFFVAEDRLFYIYDRLDRWPLAPEIMTYIVVLVEPDWLVDRAKAPLTMGEFVLLAHLLSGLDLKQAASAIGASYDTKRKQVQQILDKLGAKNQTALLRDISLEISAHILNDLLQPVQLNPEVTLAQELYGRDIIIHSVTVGRAHDVPIWEFGARHGQPILFFHSMLAPIVFTPQMVKNLKAMNLRILMMPRHFVMDRAERDAFQGSILDNLSEVIDILCDEPVICLGESAGCAWAAQFTRKFPRHVSEVIFVATPQAGQPISALEHVPSTATAFSELVLKIRSDRRVISGTTRIYNSIARVPALARRTLNFMLRHAPADLETIDMAFRELNLADWLRLIANQAARASIDEVAHLQSNWVQDIFELERPIQFFHGTQDTLCPVEDAREMAAVSRNTKFTSFDNAGHLVFGQRLPDILNALFTPQKE